MDVFILVFTGLIGFYMAWTIGANDVANSMADAVGSQALSVRNAIILAGICEFSGAVLVGASVTETIRTGIVNPDMIAALPELREGEAAALLIIGMTAALLCAAFWLHFATWVGMPVSTTHAIVGAVAGFGIVAAGWQSVNWNKMSQIVASWFISPLAGGLVAFVLFKFITTSILGKEKPAEAAKIYAPPIVFLLVFVITLATIYKGLNHIISGLHWLTGTTSFIISLFLGLICALIAKIWISRHLRGKDTLPIPKQLEEVEKIFVPLVIVSSCSVAFAHGANDVANAIGPFAAIAHIIRNGTVEMKVGVPLPILIMGGTGIVVGLATFGHKVMATVGTKITEITPSRGVAADIATSATVLICSRLSLPVSTTHTLVGAIMGIGLARGLGGINRSVTQKIFASWLITVPAAALLAIIFFVIGRSLFLDPLIEIVLTARR
ncbi:MAG: anion permease [Desulfurivibrio sp.]|jgi:PiT family inorganic phosphate transporter|nr:MAG: anion permease [Desulfurivibrio sp.]